MSTDKERSLQNDVIRAGSDCDEAAFFIGKEIRRLQTLQGDLESVEYTLNKAISEGRELDIDMLETALAARIMLAETNISTGISPGHNLAALRRLQVALTLREVEGTK